MARKPKIPEHANHERWLVSYADFITLLFAFFTVLYATAQTDAGKIKKFVGAAERAFSAGIFSAGSNELMFVNEGNTSGRELIDLGMNLKDVEKKISQELQKEGAGATGVKLERHEEGLTLMLQTRNFFMPGSDVLRPEALTLLPGVVKILKQSQRQLRIEGHTDDTPIHSVLFASNWELSTARALAVLRFLLQNGIPPQRMTVAGLAEFQPLDSNNTSQGRSRNRRVEIVILENKPSFWANLKKPDEKKGLAPNWRTLIANDQIAPPAETTRPVTERREQGTAIPEEGPSFPSPQNAEDEWRSLGSSPVSPADPGGANKTGVRP
ncbi:MAG: OmpA family protein [Elusimicrobia bacterium]|nr:OmpA family protein [Elusimicrobiota bacterium]